MVENGNNPELWKAFSDIHGPLLKTTEYFPALGNHEFDSPLYFDKFHFLHNRRWYFEEGSLRIRVIDIGSDIIDDFKIPAKNG